MVDTVWTLNDFDGRLMGGLAVRVAGRPIEPGTPQRRLVLAALLADAPRPVSVETLIARTWDGVPPDAARQVIYSHLARIRRALREAGSDLPCRDAAGYRLAVPHDQVDLHRFARLADAAGTPSRTGQQGAALDRALDAWTGAPFADVPGRWAERRRTAWTGQYVDLLHRWTRHQLHADRAAEVLRRLPAMLDDLPVVEPLETDLIRTLGRAGRVTEAVHRYLGVRDRLMDEVGIDPGPDLATAYRRLLG